MIYNHRFLILFIIIIICALNGCAEKKRQMVVPIAGAWRDNSEQMQADARDRLRAEFPGLSTDAEAALFSVNRFPFVTSAARHRAFDDKALPIGSGQSTLKLSDVAFLLSQLDLKPSDTVLEIGTGTGFLAAVLSRLVKQVYTIEIIEYLGEVAQQQKQRLSIPNIKIRIADGRMGWERYAPFDKMIITAAVREIPKPLLEQLKFGGRMAVPMIFDDDHVEWIVYQNETSEQAEIIDKFELPASAADNAESDKIETDMTDAVPQKAAIESVKDIDTKTHEPVPDDNNNSIDSEFSLKELARRRSSVTEIIVPVDVNKDEDSE